MITKFEELLNGIEKDLDIEMKPDNNNITCLKIDEKLDVYIQEDKEKENTLVLGSYLTVVPPGKFRENLFSYTLKANAQIPNIGFFSFREPTSELVLFHFINFNSLSPIDFKTILAQFIDKAMSWKEAIDSGQASPLEFSRSLENTKTSIYDIKK